MGAPRDRPSSRPQPRPRDSCYVDTAPLGAIVGDFAQRWRRDRPSANVDPGQELHPIGPYDWLSARTGVPVHRLEKIAYGTAGRETDLSEADAIVSAIGVTHAFVDGTLPVHERKLTGSAASAPRAAARAASRTPS